MAALEIVTSVFSGVWGLFSGVEVPGLGVSFASLFLGIVLMKISISIIQHVFGFGSSGTSYRSGSAKNPKISNERKGDTH